MECPQCRTRMPVQERICRGCRFFPEEGRVVEITPPRANRAPELRVLSRRHLRRLKRREPVRLVVRNRPGYLAAAVVPGLTHLLTERRWEGIGYGAAVGGLVTWGCVAGGTVGQMLVGLAASIHVQSVSSLLLVEEEGRTGERLLTTAALLIPGVALYLPLIWIVDPQAQTTVNLSPQAVMVWLTIVVVCALIFWVCTYLIAGYASAVLGWLLSGIAGIRRKR